MKILLIAPPIEDFYFTPQRAYPLGLLYLGAALKEHGCTVKIINCPHEYPRATLRLPENFAYLKKYYHANQSPFALFNNYYGYGSDYARLKTDIAAFKPDMVGIGANFSAYAGPVFKTAQLIKSVNSTIKVVIGGRAATIYPELFLREPAVDYVLRGEAEESIVKLAQALKTNALPLTIAGLCMRHKNGFHISPPDYIADLNRLRFPARELIGYTSYFMRAKPAVSLIASRGCGLNCGFCAITEKLRVRGQENVLAEMQACFDGGARHFNFEDDNINLNPQFKTLLAAIIARFGQKVQISFMNGLLSQGIIGKFGNLLISGGLTHVDFSVGSCDEKLCRKVNRNEKLNNVVKACAFMSRRKITPTVHFILGMPGQNFASCVNDVRYLAQIPAYLGPSIFYPVKESSLFAQNSGKFPFRDADWEFFRSSVASYDKAVSRNRIFTLFYACRIINFIKAGFFVVPKKMALKAYCRLKVKDISKNGALFAPQRLTRRELGTILLAKLFLTGMIFRVSEEKCKEGFIYRIYKENFVSRRDINAIFTRLLIRNLIPIRLTPHSRSGNIITLSKGG